MTNHQPLKLASMEGLWQTQSCAPLFLVGWVNEANQTTTGISIPCLLSVLAYFNPQATVTGLNAFPPTQYPPINLVFQVYHFMFRWAPSLSRSACWACCSISGNARYLRLRWVLWLFVVTVFLAEMSITAGWWTAEIGRQPWIVYNVLPTAQGVSPTLSATDVGALAGDVRRAVYRSCSSLFIFLAEREDPGRDRNRWKKSNLSRFRPCRIRSAKSSAAAGRGHERGDIMILNDNLVCLVCGHHRGLSDPGWVRYGRGHLAPVRGEER